jgi:hypothetical protein
MEISFRKQRQPEIASLKDKKENQVEKWKFDGHLSSHGLHGRYVQSKLTRISSRRLKKIIGMDGSS